MSEDRTRSPDGQDTARLLNGRLPAFLAEVAPALGPLRSAERLTGGQSNPTYRLRLANGMLVLRKQPDGDILPSAHAVDREYRVMRALAGTEVPVPEMVAYCDDREVLGTPFFLMAHLEGRVFHDSAMPGLAPAERGAIFEDMNRVMAALHLVDFEAIGLGDYGRHGGYFARQISRWSKQLDLARTRDLPELDRVRDWLQSNQPEDDETTICHGDLRLGNLICHPTEPRVIGVLDWELSTLGHPLADVAYNCIAYHSNHAEYKGLLGLDLEALGIPSEEAHLRRYYELTGREDGVTAFHLAFSLFRLAVIFEGIAARAQAGTAAATDAQAVGSLSVAYSKRAYALIDD